MSSNLNIQSKRPAKDSCLSSSSGPSGTLGWLRVTQTTVQQSSSTNQNVQKSLNIPCTTQTQDVGSPVDHRCQDPSFISEKPSNMYAGAQQTQLHCKSRNLAQARLSPSIEQTCNKTIIPGLGDFDLAVPDKPATRPTYSGLRNTAVNILRQFGLEKEDLDELLSYPDEEISLDSLPYILEQIHTQKMTRLASTDQSKKSYPPPDSSDGRDGCKEPGQAENKHDKPIVCTQSKAADFGNGRENTGEGLEMEGTSSGCANAGLMLKTNGFGKETGDVAVLASHKPADQIEKCAYTASVPELIATSQSDFCKRSHPSGTMTEPVVGCAISEDPILRVDTTLKAVSTKEVLLESNNQPEPRVQPVVVADKKENMSHHHSPTNMLTHEVTMSQLMQQEEALDEMSTQQKKELQKPNCCSQDQQQKSQPKCEVHMLPLQPLEMQQEIHRQLSQEQQLQKQTHDKPSMDEIVEDQEATKEKYCQSAITKSKRESKYDPNSSELKVTVTLPVLMKSNSSAPPCTKNKEYYQTKELVTTDPDSCKLASKSDASKDVYGTSKSVPERSATRSTQHCPNRRNSKDQPRGRSQSNLQRMSGSSSDRNKNGKSSTSERSHRSHASPHSPSPHRSHYTLDSRRDRSRTLPSSAHSTSKCNPRDRTYNDKQSPGQCRGMEDWKEKRRARSHSRSLLSSRCRPRSSGSPDIQSPSRYHGSEDRREKLRSKSRSRSPLASRCKPRPVRTSHGRSASTVRSPQKSLPPRRQSSTSRSKEKPPSPSNETKVVLRKESKSYEHGEKTSAEQLAKGLLEMPDIQALSDKCDIDAVVSLTPAMLAVRDELLETSSPPITEGGKAEPRSSSLPSSHSSSSDSAPPAAPENKGSCEQSSSEGNLITPQMQSATPVHHLCCEENGSELPNSTEKYPSHETKSLPPAKKKPIPSSQLSWSNFCFKFLPADKMPNLEPKQNVPSNTDANKPSIPTMVRLCGILPCISRKDVVSAMGDVGKTKSVLLIRSREEAVVCFERKEDAKKLKTFEIKGCKITVKPKETASGDKKNSSDRRAILANVHFLVESTAQETSLEKSQPVKSIVVKTTSPPGACVTPKHPRSASGMVPNKVPDVGKHDQEGRQPQQSQGGLQMRPSPASLVKPVSPGSAPPSMLPTKLAEKLKTSPTLPAQSKDIHALQPLTVVPGKVEQIQQIKHGSSPLQKKPSQDASLMEANPPINNVKDATGSTEKTATTPKPPSLSSPLAVTVKQADKGPPQNVQEHMNTNKLQPQTVIPGKVEKNHQCKPGSTQPQQPKTQSASITKPKPEDEETGPVKPSKPPGTAALKTKQLKPGSFRSKNVWECININEFKRKLENCCLRNLTFLSKEKFVSLDKRHLLITNLPRYHNGNYTENDIINLIKPYTGKSIINVGCIMTEACMAVVIFQYAKYLYDVIQTSLALRGWRLNLQVLNDNTIACTPLGFFKYAIKQVDHTQEADGSKTVFFSNVLPNEIKELSEVLKSNNSVLYFLPLLNKIFIEFKTLEDSDQFGLWLHRRKQSIGSGFRRLQQPGRTLDTCRKDARIPKGTEPPFHLTLSSSPYLFMTATPTFRIPEYVSINEMADLERVKSDGAKFQTVMLTGLPLKGSTYKDIVDQVGTYFPKTSQHLLIHKVIVLPLQRRAFVLFDDWSSCFDFVSDHMKTPLTMKASKLYVHFVIEDLFQPCNEENMYTSMMKLSNSPVTHQETLTGRLLYVWISQFSNEVLESVLKLVISLGPFLSILPLANRICFEMANSSDVNKKLRYLPSQQFSMNPSPKVESLPALKQRIQNSIEADERRTLPPAVKPETQHSLRAIPNLVSVSPQQTSVQTAKKTMVSTDSSKNENVEKSEVQGEVSIPKSQNDANNKVPGTVESSGKTCRSRIQEQQTVTDKPFNSENNEVPSKSLADGKSDTRCTEVCSPMSESTTEEAGIASQHGMLDVASVALQEKSGCASSLKSNGSPSQVIVRKPRSNTSGLCSKLEKDSSEISQELRVHEELLSPDQNGEASVSAPEQTDARSPQEVVRPSENQTVVQRRESSASSIAAIDLTLMEEYGPLRIETSKLCDDVEAVIEGHPVQLPGSSVGVRDVKKEAACERGVCFTEDHPPEQSKGDEAENESAPAMEGKNDHINSKSCEGQPVQNIEMPARCSTSRSSIMGNRIKAAGDLDQGQEKTVLGSVEDSTADGVMTRSGRRRRGFLQEHLSEETVTVQKERMTTRAHSLSPGSTATKSNVDLKNESDANTENKLPNKRKRGRPKKNLGETALAQNEQVNKTEFGEETPSRSRKNKRQKKGKDEVDDVKEEGMNVLGSEPSLDVSNNSVPTADHFMEEEPKCEEVDDDEYDEEVVAVEGGNKVMEKATSHNSCDVLLVELGEQANDKEEGRGAPAQTLLNSTNDGQNKKGIQTTKRQRKDTPVEAKLQSQPQSKRVFPPSGAALEFPKFNPNKPLGQEFIQPTTGYCCSLCAMFYIKEKTALEAHCSTQRHYDNLKAYYQKLQCLQSGPCRKMPLKSTSDVNS